MVSLKDLPSPSTVYAAYASISASTMLLRTTINQVIPSQLQNSIVSAIRHYIFNNRSTSQLTLVIQEKDGMSQNELYQASEIFTSTKFHPCVDYLNISKTSKEDHLNIKFDKSETIVDFFQDVEITWRFVREKLENSSYDDDFEDCEAENKYFELSFDKKHKDFVVNCYVPFVLEKSKAIQEDKKVLKLHTLVNRGSAIWDSIKLEHPSTFDKIAMDPNLKKDIIADLDMFVQRKDYYKRIGKAWKRGYLLHGPPGTGKSSLIAAMANYLKFDIYDLQLMNVKSGSSFRKLLLATCNKSILVIEDIDCSVELPDRMGQQPRNSQSTLSGLLNSIDGLWTSCGDERITIFTTNNKERLDPALLRPGRMDMHIHMSYLSINGLKILASNYLGINIESHSRYKEIKHLIRYSEVTPAEVAEELMKSSNISLCIQGLVEFLKGKKTGVMSKQTTKADGINTFEIQIPDAKRQKTDVVAEV
ncbi:AAA-type ATPase [Heracleum sosnowskyi]|uniref:AAA-type ATPase n=1 Tax=Heracleum sosnowskyi TaxID=360622 RepID=A0AAD8HVC3_9APIA|nr:AAA-type ATPase [Heracleum sosnowskyi]